MHRYQGLNGEVLPNFNASNLLLIEYVLHSFRDVWVPIKTYPFLAVDVERVEKYCAEILSFAVFTRSFLMQNMRPDEGSQRIFSALVGGAIDAGISPSAEMHVEGMANPSAHWMMSMNDPFMLGMHPFAALHTHYVFVDDSNIYQRKFGELIILDGYSRPSSQYVDFNPLADLTHTFHCEYTNQRRELLDLSHLSELLDAIFVENTKVLTAATMHHNALAPHDKPFNYVAPTLTHYGRLIHDNNRTPRIELSFALLHYEKALREFNDLKVASAMKDVDGAFYHGVYCVVAVAACIEAIANKLVYLQSGSHPDYKNRFNPFEKINSAASSIAHKNGQVFVPLEPGNPVYDALNRARMLRNSFMHAKESDEAIDAVALTSTVFVEVDEEHCRAFLRQLRLGVAVIYDQLPEHNPPIVTRDNVKWFGELEVP